MPPKGQVTDPVARFWAKVEKTDTCWLWTAGTGGYGYGSFNPDGRRDGPRRNVAAHLYAYRLLVGEVPEGLELDHLCRNKRCVNPAHLEPVTHRENVLRGTGPTAENAKKTTCVRGHDLTDPANVYPGSNRKCVTCAREFARRQYEASRDA